MWTRRYVWQRTDTSHTKAPGCGDISWSNEGVEPKPAGAVSPETLQLQESGDASVFAVLDSTGSVAGILTLDEMVRAFARQMTAVT